MFGRRKRRDRRSAMVSEPVNTGYVSGGFYNPLTDPLNPLSPLYIGDNMYDNANSGGEIGSPDASGDTTGPAPSESHDTGSSTPSYDSGSSGGYDSGSSSSGSSYDSGSSSSYDSGSSSSYDSGSSGGGGDF